MPSKFNWVTTLKFKIVTMAVVTGVMSALVTAQLVLTTTQANIQRMLLQSAIDDGESIAMLLSTKLDMLQNALKAVAHQVPPGFWQDSDAMARYLADKAALGALFDSVLAVRADGDMLARTVKGVATFDLPNVANRDYFRQSIKSDQPVVSEPIVGKILKEPLIVIAIATPLQDGKTPGILAGSLALQSTSLFSDVTRTRHQNGLRTLVMDRAGVVLAHPDPSRILGRAKDEPGLADVFAKWHSSGSPIDSTGVATLSEAYLVSRVGIPGTDWTVVSLAPQAMALQPVTAARVTAWKAATGVGLVAAFLAGVLAWYLTRPISKLRVRAEKMLAETVPAGDGWPHDGGEVGELALAFQQVVEQRQQRQGETQALLQQLEAVLDHAEVGIALTRNGHFELVSRHFCHIFRCEKQHALGQPSRMIYASDEAYEALSNRAHPSFMTHGAFDGEVELMRRSGQLFWAQMRGRAVVPGDRSKGTIWTIEDVTEVREQRERLTYTSNHDSLTGLANRPAFEALLERATARATTEPFCALFIDLDHFKAVNDTGGHAAGDALLRDVAHTLAAQVRNTDTVARLGGDEFAVLLGRCPLPQALEIAEKLRKAVVAYHLAWEGQTFGVGASIGLVGVDATFSTAADVLRAADSACYAAKQSGRDCVAVYEPKVTSDLASK